VNRITSSRRFRNSGLKGTPSLRCGTMSSILEGKPSVAGCRKGQGCPPLIEEPSAPEVRCHMMMVFLEIDGVAEARRFNWPSSNTLQAGCL